MNRINIIPENRNNRFILLAILLLIISIELIWIFDPQLSGITGLATYEETTILTLNKTYNNNTIEQLNIQSQITSLSIDASITGVGKAVIWLEYNNTKVLVARLSTDNIIEKENENLITGLVTQDIVVDREILYIEENTENITQQTIKTEEDIITDNITTEETTNTTDINITDNITIDINITDNNTTDINITNNNTTDINTNTTEDTPIEEIIEITEENTTEEIIEITEENTTEEITNTTIEIIEENTTEEEIIDIEENTTIETNTQETSTTFASECIDSCSINGAPPYNLIIELSNVTLHITKINYQIKQEPIIQVQTIPNITLDAINNSSIITLSEYFKSARELSYDINAIETDTFNILINEETLQISIKNSTIPDVVNAYIYATDGENIIISNTFTISNSEEINSTNVSIKTTQYPARINERVRWTKKVTSTEQESKINIPVPNNAENITITRNNKDDTAIKEHIITQTAIKKDSAALPENMPVQKRSNDKTIELMNEDNKISLEEARIEELNQNAESIIPLEITSTIKDIEIEYYTSAPTATESSISETQKEIIVSSNTHYTNVLSYTNLPIETKDDKWIKLIWKINATQNTTDLNLTEEEISIINSKGYFEKEMQFTSYDTNSNGLIDYIEWIAPHLSEQKFIIIVITKADLLDENKTFIQSIYDEVKEQDGTWFNVTENNYVRATFEQELTSINDITIYARSYSENASIIVYKEESDEIMAEFTNLSQEKYYKIYLQGLNESEDTFDLKIVGGTIELDHIIDPTPIITWNMTLITTYQDNAPANSIEGARGMQYDGRGYMIIASTTDDSFTILDVNNPASLSVRGSINDNVPPGSVDNIWFGTLDDDLKLFYAPSFTDDTISIYNVTAAGPVLLNDTGIISANNATSSPPIGSLDQIYDVAYVDSGTSRYCVASASVDDTVSVYNCTNPKLLIRSIFYRNTAANPCTTDDIRKLYNIPGTTYIIGASATDYTLSVWNVLSNGTLTCVTNYTDNAPPLSIEGLQDFYFENSTKLLYVAAPTDDSLTILNLTNLINSGGAMTTVGSINHTTNLNSVISVGVGTIGSDKFAFLGSSSTTVADFRVRIVNVTIPSSPTYYGSFNQTLGTCRYNQTYSVYVKDDYLFASSGGDSCFYSIKLYDATYITPSNTSARISPEIPTIASNLIGYCNSTDDDDLYYNYIWYLNDEINTSGTTVQSYASGLEINVANISSSQLIVGQNWTFSCQANDTLNFSAWTNSSTITIVNTPPIIINASITPHVAYANESLYGYCNATDIEYNNLTYNYIWYLNGEINISGNYTTSYCYQESANKSTTCGGLNTGHYANTSGWNNAHNAFDNDVGTSATYDTIASTARLYFNYTKPYSALYGSNITTKIDLNRQYTIPYECMTQSEIQLMYTRTTSGQQGTLSCNNGTDWQSIVVLTNPGNRFYEEEINWSMGIVHGVNTLVSSIPSSQLIVGQNWTFSCQANDTLNFSAWTNSSTVQISEIPSSTPVLTSVQPVGNVDPIEYDIKRIAINFTVNDNDGNSTINISSAIVKVNNSGIIRTSSGCFAIAINATAQNVSCNVSMQYYDPSGIWSVNISIRDDTNNYVENTTTTLTYNELSAIQISSNSINIGAVSVGQQDIGLTPLIINNTGNSLFTNISVKAFDLINSTYIISAGNFTINTTNSQSGQSLVNNTHINITGSALSRNNDTVKKNVTLYIYLDVPSTPLIAGYYKSTSEWIIIASK